MSTAVVVLIVGVLTGLSVRRYLKMRGKGCGGCGSCPYSRECSKKK